MKKLLLSVIFVTIIAGILSAENWSLFLILLFSVLGYINYDKIFK